MSTKDERSEHARALGELGAAKGGRARAKALTPEERSEIARLAAQKRWGNRSGLPRATHAGPLNIGNASIPAYVLENGERILSTRGIMKGLQRRWRGRKYAGTKLPVFLEANNLKPFISEELVPVLSPKMFITYKGAKSQGYRAEILPEVCEIYLKAREQRILTKPQEAIAGRCEILMRALSKVGIIALVDEATGYQADRAKDELVKILEAYISKELLPWTKRFPDEFFGEVYRLQGWEFKPGNVRRPSYVGKLIKKLVYKRLPPGVLEELERQNPVADTGYRKFKHHQFLTVNTGHPHLDKQITAVTTLMRASESQETFNRLFDRAFPYRGQQLSLALKSGENEEEE